MTKNRELLLSRRDSLLLRLAGNTNTHFDGSEVCVGGSLGVTARGQIILRHSLSWLYEVHLTNVPWMVIRDVFKHLHIPFTHDGDFDTRDYFLDVHKTSSCRYRLDAGSMTRDTLAIICRWIGKEIKHPSLVTRELQATSNQLAKQAVERERINTLKQKIIPKRLREKKDYPW